MPEGLAPFLLTALALVGSPGPNTLSVAATGAAFGRRRGVAYMVGIVLGMVGVIAIVATGVAGVFMETHPDPSQALSDGPNAWPLDDMPALLETLKRIDETVKSGAFAESAYGLGAVEQ